MVKKYTKAEAIEKSTEYFNGDSLAAEVFVNKYALKDREQNILESTPEQMHRRIAAEFARIEKKYPSSISEEEIFKLLDKFRFVVPQGSPMFGIGNQYYTTSLANCFVLDVVDSYGGICWADERIAQVAKRRGGTGADISSLRPKGLATNNSALTTDGIVVFMERFSNTSREVAQCIAEDQRVLTKNGLVPIKEVTPKDYVWTRIGWVRVMGNMQNMKRVYKVVTGSGYEIKTSLDHIFMVYENDAMKEKRLKDISIDDEVVLLCGTNTAGKNKKIKFKQHYYKNSNNKPNNCVLPTELNENMAYFIGYSYGDGYVEKNKYGEPRVLSLACAHKYPEIENKLVNIIKKEFHYGATSLKGDGALNKVSIHNKCVVDFLDNNGLLKEKSGDIVFPRKMLGSPTAVLCSFISGYFDADGYASGRKKGYAFASVSLNFLKVIQSVLISWGILSKIHSEDRSDMGWKDLHTLSVVGTYSKNIFVDMMSESIKVKLIKDIGKSDNWLTPYRSKDLATSHCQYDFVPDNTQNISVACYQKLAQCKNIPKGILTKDYIVSIEECQETTTYDLQLEEEHLFWCEGFYVHNSGRRGALMLSISVHHPEILNFIRAKRDLQKVTGANISVKISDEFMDAVKKDKTYELRWPVDSDKPVISQKVKAKEVWDELIKSNWSAAEPGVLYWDTILKNSPADSYADVGYRTRSTNPCGELPLSNNASCILLLQNLTSFVLDPFTDKAKFDEENFKKNTRISQRLMDDMVDLEIEAVTKIIEKVKSDPEPDKIKANELDLWEGINKTASESRRTGLGITGLGDCLAMLNIKYGSKESIKMVEKIYTIMRDETYRSSIELAKERGAFPIWDHKKEKDNGFLNRLPDDIKSEMKKYGRRNIACMTTSPAGSVSTITQTTSGFEPVFMAEYKRKRKISDNEKEKADFVDSMGDKWKEYTVEHHGLKLFKKITGKEFKDSPYNGAQAHEIDYEARVKMQAVATSYTDHAISSCLATGTSFIQTNKGLFDISELCSSSGKKGFVPVLVDNIKTINSNGELVSIKEGFYNGVQEVLKVTMVGGYEIIGTPNHKVVVIDSNYDLQWKRLCDLKKDDFIVGRKGLKLSPYALYKMKINAALNKNFDFEHKTNSKKITIPQHMSLDLALFLGILCSDGSLGPNGINLCQIKNNVCNKFEILVRKLFGVKTKWQKDNRSDNLYNLVVNSRILMRYMRWLGISNHDYIRVPKIVRLSPLSYVKKFISGVTLGGYVSKDKLCVSTSVSKTYLQQIQMLLLNMGIDSVLLKTADCGLRKLPNSNKKYKTKKAYGLFICRFEDINTFMNEIGFIEERKNNEFKTKFIKNNSNKPIGEIPDFDLRLRFRKEILPKIKSKRLYELFHSMTCKDKRDRMMNRQTLLELCDLGFQVKPILKDKSFVFRQIKSIRKTGKKVTLDLSVPQGHSYIANGLISHNTINLPNDISLKTVDKIYMMAYDEGCKGITIYRDGSREGVLTSTSTKHCDDCEEASKQLVKLIQEGKRPSKIIQASAPKRPETVGCEIHRSKVGGGDWLFFIGLLNDIPYEVFGGDSEKFTIPHKYKEGWIIKNGEDKNGVTQYNLILGSLTDENEKLEFKCISKHFNNYEYGAFTRAISLSIRHGVPIKYICEQITKPGVEGDLFSFQRAMARILKKYIAEGESSQQKCPICGADMKYVGGCPKCKICGHSNCA